MPDGDKKEQLVNFKVSGMWCHRFKSRNQLVARRHTTTHSLPEDFQELAMDFIKSVHAIIEEFNITRECIVNFDQVPRYFEIDKCRTITKKGTREVLLKKSSTSHKRFTFTPFVTAAGKFSQKHALFSNLVKVPKHHPQCNVSVNKTGMFSMDILKSTIDDSIKQIRGLFSTKSILFIMDSYAVHLKFLREQGDAYKAKNVHFAVVPPRLTGLSQPLDVALNRSYQQFVNDKSGDYQEDATQKVRNNFDRFSKCNKFFLFRIST